MDFKNLKQADIEKWCLDNNQMDWLVSLVNTPVKVKVYPKVASVSKNGKKSWKADKTQPYTLEERDIPFVEIKAAFLRKFFPEQISAKEDKETFKERINRLYGKK